MAEVEQTKKQAEVHKAKQADGKASLTRNSELEQLRTRAERAEARAQQSEHDAAESRAHAEAVAAELKDAQERIAGLEEEAKRYGCLCCTPVCACDCVCV